MTNKFSDLNIFPTGLGKYVEPEPPTDDGPTDPFMDFDPEREFGYVPDGYDQIVGKSYVEHLTFGHNAFSPRDIRLPRPKLCLVREHLLSGSTPAGLWAQHDHSLPKIEGFIVIPPADNPEGFIVGDRVLFKRYAGTEVPLGTDIYLIFHADDLLAIVEESEGVL